MVCGMYMVEEKVSLSMDCLASVLIVRDFLVLWTKYKVLSLRAST